MHSENCGLADGPSLLPREGGRDPWDVRQSQRRAPPQNSDSNSDPDASLSTSTSSVPYPAPHLSPFTMVSLQKGALDANTTSTPSTLYIPIASPPTPAPSPGPFTNDGHDNLLVNTINFPPVNNFQQFAYDPTLNFSSLSEQARLEYLNKIIAQCTLRELSHLSALINPLLKRDFLRELPTELALHVLSYIHDLYQLVKNVAGVCKHWRRLSNDDWLWRRMCQRWEFAMPLYLQDPAVVPGSAKRHFKIFYLQREFTNQISHFPCTPPCPLTPTHRPHQE